MNLLLLLLAFISRKVIIDSLGDNITGLNSTLYDLLGFLNLAEMGVLSAVAFSLYKPLHDNDEKEINNIVSILSYIYRNIGFIILGAGVILSLFLPMLFSGKGVDIVIIYMGYYTFLAVNLFSYFLNYKQNILIADQQNWVIVSTLGFVNIVKIILQVTVLYYVNESLYIKYFCYLALELIFGVIYSAIINKRVAKIYPWLRPSWRLGRELKGNYTSIFKRVKQLFSHKIGNFVLTQTDSIVISVISSSFLAVTIYTNYIIIFSRLTRLFFGAFDNIGAGIGNLIAEGESKKVLSTYRELNSIFFLIAGVVVICGYHLTNPFIEIWLGEDGKFIIDNYIYIVILFNIYISIIRRVSELFINANGLFSDVWAPWTEAAINLTISIVAGYKFGVIGVVTGTLISTFIIGVIWKPFFLFSRSFKLNTWGYYKILLKYTTTTAVIYFAVHLILRAITIETPTTYIEWFIYASLLTSSVTILLLISFMAVDSSTRFMFKRLYNLLLSKVKRV